MLLLVAVLRLFLVLPWLHISAYTFFSLNDFSLRSMKSSEASSRRQSAEVKY